MTYDPHQKVNLVTERVKLLHELLVLGFHAVGDQLELVPEPIDRVVVVAAKAAYGLDNCQMGSGEPEGLRFDRVDLLFERVDLVVEPPDLAPRPGGAGAQHCGKMEEGKGFLQPV